MMNKPVNDAKRDFIEKTEAYAWLRLSKGPLELPIPRYSTIITTPWFNSRTSSLELKWGLDDA